MRPPKGAASPLAGSAGPVVTPLSRGCPDTDESTRYHFFFHIFFKFHHLSQTSLGWLNTLIRQRFEFEIHGRFLAPRKEEQISPGPQRRCIQRVTSCQYRISWLEKYNVGLRAPAEAMWKNVENSKRCLRLHTAEPDRAKARQCE